MPVTKNAAFRHRIIDCCLRNTLRPYPNIEQLQDQVTDALNLENRISRSSIDKDSFLFIDQWFYLLDTNKYLKFDLSYRQISWFISLFNKLVNDTATPYK
jgi:hypothetical protein